MDFAPCFDDVLLKPQYFEGSSRSEINLQTSIAGVLLDAPILSSNMSSVTSLKTCIELAKQGGMGILHRFQSTQEQQNDIREFQKTKTFGNTNRKIGGSIGIGKDDLDCAERLIVTGVDIICMDVAHAHQRHAILFVLAFKERFGDFPLIIGNIATKEAAQSYIDILSPKKYPKTALKVGIGGGSLCSTRIVTAHGLPTLASLMEIAPAVQNESDWSVIADGGIKGSGDACKALVLSDSVMLGSIFAGTTEAPGAIIKDHQGNLCKVYRGSASYGQKNESGNIEYIEGEETLIKYKGPIAPIISQLKQGIRSGLSYSGAMTLKDFQRKAQFVQISSAGFNESKPHLINR